jgi:hypothetical protein
MRVKVWDEISEDEVVHLHRLECGAYCSSDLEHFSPVGGGFRLGEVGGISDVSSCPRHYAVSPHRRPSHEIDRGMRAVPDVHGVVGVALASRSAHRAVLTS